MSEAIKVPALLEGTVNEWLKSKHLRHATVRYRLGVRAAIKHAGDRVKPGDKVWSVEVDTSSGSLEAYAVQPAEGTQLVWPNEAASMLDRLYKKMQERLGI